MQELEVLQTFLKESLTLGVTLVIILLVVKPKDKQIEDKMGVINEQSLQMQSLIEVNKDLAEEVKRSNDQVEGTLVELTGTMKEISSELSALGVNQEKLKDGQEELWKEIVQLKRGI
ncbi:TPA: hypothetical protein QC153_002122 [Bacillus cereus]|uniref:hypothetical protein n=1 Tax=Bacillus toyonensis TaxID=155322 RepID=UPI000BF245C3|nr:hypothetical protein [Bacillus toyonensis]PEL24323.1 hypothetical protein CN624_18210 [Bacillus toyonensis]HDR8302769.1 hypothetical protein [Bacillus cereus]